MSYKVDKASGGPYSHEIDAIRDERYRAKVMDIEPDFTNVFKDVVISPGALAVIEDINKPIELPQGEFIENVVFHDEEEASPEASPAEEEPASDKGTAEETAPAVSAPEPGTPEVVEPVVPATIAEATASVDTLGDILDPTVETPIYAQAEEANHVVAG